MAEALLLDYGGERLEVHSAGTKRRERINPFIVVVMDAIDISLTGQSPKDLNSVNTDGWI